MSKFVGLSKGVKFIVQKVAGKKSPTITKTKPKVGSLTERRADQDDVIRNADKAIKKRNLTKKTTGVVITEISNRSPLANLLNVNDIIIEVQKTSVKNSSNLNKIVDSIFKKGEKTLLLTIINNNNRRRYLGVKIN